MCYTLIVSFTIIYSAPYVLNESVPGKDAEGSPKNRWPDARAGASPTPTIYGLRRPIRCIVGATLAVALGWGLYCNLPYVRAYLVCQASIDREALVAASLKKGLQPIKKTFKWSLTDYYGGYYIQSCYEHSSPRFLGEPTQRDVRWVADPCPGSPFFCKRVFANNVCYY